MRADLHMSLSHFYPNLIFASQQNEMASNWVSYSELANIRLGKHNSLLESSNISQK